MEINTSRLWCNLSIGLITIVSYMIDVGGKCIVYFYDEKKLDDKG